MSAVPRQIANHKPRPDYAMAERRCWSDLPELLPNYTGRWVASTAQGRFSEGDDEMSLFRQCEQAGMERGHFLVARVEPDAPVAHIPMAWATPNVAQISNLCESGWQGGSSLAE